MPLTAFQLQLLALLAPNRTPESYMAGGTAILFKPNSTRFSRDFDIFHDSESLVAEAFKKDCDVLTSQGFRVDVQISQPGFLRATVSGKSDSTQIDWARESAWRFMPVQKDSLGGYVLSDIDLATGKVLTLAGRNEPRDLIDVLYLVETVLALGPLIWAAVEKDPGYAPRSLLEMLRRRGRIQPEDLGRLDLRQPLKPEILKDRWLNAMEDAERFIESRPPDEVGCLYYSVELDQFVEPDPERSLEEQHIVIHHGRLGGVLPRIANG